MMKLTQEAKQGAFSVVNLKSLVETPDNIVSARSLPSTEDDSNSDRWKLSDDVSIRDFGGFPEEVSQRLS